MSSLGIIASPATEAAHVFQFESCAVIVAVSDCWHRKIGIATVSEYEPIAIVPSHEQYEHPRETRRRQQPFYRGLKKYRKHL